MKLTLLTAVTGAIVLSVQMALAQSTFTRITTGPVVTDQGTSNTGIWLDYDNDGDLDLYVVNGDMQAALPSSGHEPNFLYRNDGNGAFTRITSGPLVEDVEKSACGVAGDYNNDGYLDVFVGNLGNMDNSLYRNNGDSTFTKIVIREPSDTLVAGWADYDNDGHLDLAVINTHTARSIWHNNGNETFSRVTQGPLATDITDAEGASWGDYDNDGDVDLFVANSFFPPNGARRNSFYRNEGHGNFTRLTTGALVAESANYSVGVWGDYDNDGDLDLFVTDWGEGHNFLFQNNGDGTFRKITSGEIVTETGKSLSAAWGDYDNDGFLDLFVACGQTTAENNRLYHNNGDGTFTRITTGAIVTDGGHSLGCDWGDYDNDGFLDLFVANTGWEQNFLYHNDGNTNRWLKVKLVGTVSNRAAIGAKVRVQASLGGVVRWQLRELSTGSSASGHNLLAHFGLRDAPKVDLVRIEWPSGIIQELSDVSANQVLTVTEPPQLATTGPGQFHIESWRGQRFETQVSTNLLDWSSLGLVTNLTGNLTFNDRETANQERRFYRVVCR